MRIRFDENTDVIPQICGNCRHYYGDYCKIDRQEDEDSKSHEKTDACPFFEWEG